MTGGELLTGSPAVEFGLPEPAEMIYRAIVQRERADPDALADDVAMPAGVVSEAVDHLMTLGLVQLHDGALEAMPPRLPMQALADRYVRAAAAARETAETLARVWTRQSTGPDYLEPLTSTAAVVAAAVALHEHATKEVRALSIGPSGDSAPPPHQHPGAAEALRRGVAYRVVYGAQILRQPAVMAMVQESAEAGEAARVFPTVPCNLQIADGERAVLIAPMSGPERLHGLVFSPSGFLDSLIEVFETYWTLAIPISAGKVAFDAEQGPNDDTRKLLALLGAGLTDASIARELGVSERTVTRRIMALQDALAARSRFQLGVQAARRGWL
ncbi:LuxR C-terminal-related transcriptional regulator [Labedaea rhizosphaerae]|uniref:Regulatory LuxR family protein n=1 Tax=Labedaea rhizosphaerae TaxID=598644 RepID=A0A4R6SDZ7_LABRH|nr:LuxR C-terminal-related transcriptional regulator [Labedaea rhizosphaerae]TDP98112.1 regulatory LuxR family protein [Labedaea rhizosphaerae]